MTKQFATFYVHGRLYGVDVMKVQEVTRELALTPVPLAPAYVRGLINLRGQIAPAIGMRILIEGDAGPADQAPMTVICQDEDGLLSLLVDRVGDVIEVTRDQLEAVPNNLSPRLRDLLTGVYKLETELLSIIELNKLNQFLNHPENHHAEAK